MSFTTDQGLSWNTYRTNDGLGANITYGTYEQDGKLYVATFGGGISVADMYSDIVGATEATYTFTPSFPQAAECGYQVLISDQNGCPMTSAIVHLTLDEGCSIDCQPSYEGINKLTGMQAMDADFETAGGIDSNQLIINGAKVDYDAAVDIDLLPDFEIQLGAEVDIFIDGCNNGAGGNQ